MAGLRPKVFFDGAVVRAAIVTCGGLCPGINNVIRTLVMELHYRYSVRSILGIRYGLPGVHPEARLRAHPAPTSSRTSMRRAGACCLPPAGSRTRGPSSTSSRKKGSPSFHDRGRRHPAGRVESVPGGEKAGPFRFRHRDPQDRGQRHRFRRTYVRAGDRFLGRGGIPPERAHGSNRRPLRDRHRQSHGTNSGYIAANAASRSTRSTSPSSPRSLSASKDPRPVRAPETALRKRDHAVIIDCRGRRAGIREGQARKKDESGNAVLGTSASSSKTPQNLLQERRTST